MDRLLAVWSDRFDGTLVWAATCLGLFYFMTGRNSHQQVVPVIPFLPSDIVVDSHMAPSMLKIFLHQAKNDPFKQGISLSRVCQNLALSMASVLNYLAIQPPLSG